MSDRPKPRSIPSTELIPRRRLKASWPTPNGARAAAACPSRPAVDRQPPGRAGSLPAGGGDPPDTKSSGRLTRDMKKVPPSPDQVRLRTGDRVRVEVSASRPSRVPDRLQRQPQAGTLNLLYPEADAQNPRQALRSPPISRYTSSTSR